MSKKKVKHEIKVVNDSQKETPDTKRRVEWDRNHVLIKSTYVQLIKDLQRLPTQTEVGKACGLSRETVHKHFDTLKFEPLKHPARVLTDQVVLSIAQSSFKGKSASQKLWMQVMEGWVEKTETEVNGDLAPVTKVELMILPPINAPFK